MAKYLVIGDWIRSANDGDRHYISARQLVELYGIDPRDCKTIENNQPMSLVGVDLNKFVVLRPLFHGKYREHIAKLEMGLLR
jgi:hypothetical protein